MYTLKFQEEFKEKLVEKIQIPQTPFIISHKDGNYYIVSKLNNSNKYVLTGDNGITYDNDYCEQWICDNLNDGIWILRKANINIIK